MPIDDASAWPKWLCHPPPYCPPSSLSGCPLLILITTFHMDECTRFDSDVLNMYYAEANTYVHVLMSASS